MAVSQAVARKSVRELVSEQRRRLYASGHHNLNMVISGSLVERIDRCKAHHRLPSRDAVVAQIIRRCSTTTAINDLVLKGGPAESAGRRISPIIPGDLVDYVQRVQRHFPGLAYGPIVEMMAASVGDRLGFDHEDAIVDRGVPGTRPRA